MISARFFPFRKNLAGFSHKSRLLLVSAAFYVPDIRADNSRMYTDLSFALERTI